MRPWLAATAPVSVPMATVVAASEKTVVPRPRPAGRRIDAREVDDSGFDPIDVDGLDLQHDDDIPLGVDEAAAGDVENLLEDILYEVDSFQGKFHRHHGDLGQDDLQALVDQLDGFRDFLREGVVVDQGETELLAAHAVLRVRLIAALHEIDRLRRRLDQQVSQDATIGAVFGIDQASKTHAALDVTAASDIVRNLVRSRLPEANTVLLTGSIARGEARPHSDIDVVVLFEKVEAGAWRETVEQGGRIVEIFCHDPETLRYFCDQVDRAAGRDAMPDMIHHGIPVEGFPNDLVADAKAIAASTLKAGPPALTDDDIDARRYEISDVAEDLRDCHALSTRFAIAAKLYGILCDFVLRANGQWSAGGKTLAVRLAAYDPHLAKDITDAFYRLLVTGDDAEVQQRVDHVLDRFSGRLSAGFVRHAPEAWRLEQ